MYIYSECLVGIVVRGLVGAEIVVDSHHLSHYERAYTTAYRLPLFFVAFLLALSAALLPAIPIYAGIQHIITGRT